MNKYLGTAIIVIIVIGGISMGGGLDRAIDLLSLIFVLGVAIGHTLGAKEGENTLTRFWGWLHSRRLVRAAGGRYPNNRH